MNDNKCEFCNGTGIEPGQTGCVWCDSTGTKEGQKMLSQPAQQGQRNPIPLPEGYMLAERSIWTEQQVEAATACITRLKGVPGIRDRDLAMAAIDAAQCKAPEVTLADLLPAQQGQGEPVATVRSVTNRKSSVFDIVIHDNQALHPGTKLFLHADPAEVAQAKALAETAADQVVKLLAQLRDANDKLAERDALLRDISTGYWRNDVEMPYALVERIKALSASAEPSAPVEKIKLYLNVSNVHVTINPDGSYTIDPVQIDERAEFEKWWSSRTSVDPYTKGEHWDAWQARAALEGKP